MLTAFVDSVFELGRVGGGVGGCAEWVSGEGGRGKGGEEGMGVMRGEVAKRRVGTAFVDGETEREACARYQGVDWIAFAVYSQLLMCSVKRFCRC